MALLDNGQCGICPANLVADPNTRKCVSQCLSGQTIQNGRCVCQPGYGIAAGGSCVSCDSIGAFLSNGYCVVCPNGKVWNGNGCVCPTGQTEK